MIRILGMVLKNLVKLIAAEFIIKGMHVVKVIQAYLTFDLNFDPSPIGQ